MKKLQDMDFSELYSLRCAAKSICDDLSEMATTYSVVNGNVEFCDLPAEMQKTITERQEFYGYVQRINEHLKTKIRETFSE